MIRTILTIALLLILLVGCEKKPDASPDAAATSDTRFDKLDAALDASEVDAAAKRTDASGGDK